MKSSTSLHQWKLPLLFLGSQTLSLFGSSLVQYAIIWHITLSTSSGVMLTLSTLCGFLPQLFLALFAGAWLDRISRKRLILLADGAIALTTLALAVAFYFDIGSLWMLFAALSIRSAGTGLQTPAVQALIPQITPPDALARINGLQSALNALTTFLAPAVSGLLLSLFPQLALIFLIDVVTAALGMGVLICLAIPRLARSASSSSLTDLREGIAYLRRNASLRHLLFFQAAMLTLISPAAFLTPLLVSRVFGPEIWRLSASEMLYSAGAVAGGLLITVLGGYRQRLRTVTIAGSVYGLSMTGMALAPFFPLYLLCNALIGVASPCYSAALTTHIQETTPPDLHGRVFAFLQVTTSCAFPLGMILFGPLADLVPLPYLMSACGIAALALAWKMGRSA